MADKTIKQLTTEFTSLTADDYFIAQRDTDNVTGKVKNSAVFNGGWSPVESPPDTVVANGNRSYTLTFNSLDLTDTISPGMRVRTTRTVAAPTQCTDLESGSSQYYNDTSVSGMTFTDDFVVSAWIKLESYAALNSASTIASRYNGTSGWRLEVFYTGQIRLLGVNAGSANVSYVVSYRAVPLGKWVHITAQLDMSAFTATTTTSYIMFDGEDVPSAIARSGSNPTALIQAGNLEIGSTNSGTLLFDGKIAQVAIYSAKVTQATILASIDRTLTGSETSLVSAYSFNNSINDLSANANNLTAQNSAVATNADSPFGNEAASSTLDYGLVQSVSFSTNTTMIVQVPIGCTIPTTGGVTSMAYSVQKNPYGWVSSIEKWHIESLVVRFSFTNNFGSINQWYSSSQNLIAPIGTWLLEYAINFGLASTVSGIRTGSISLSSTNYPVADTFYNDLACALYNGAASTDFIINCSKSATRVFTARETITPVAQISYASGTEKFTTRGDLGGCYIRLIPSGL